MASISSINYQTSYYPFYSIRSYITFEAILTLNALSLAWMEDVCVLLMIWYAKALVCMLRTKEV